MNFEESVCWICGGRSLVLVKASNIPNIISTQDFAITDSNYGTTGDIYRCEKCGFMQCTRLQDVLSYYERIEDASYEEYRQIRALQQNKLLLYVRKIKKFGRLLDIGAGSGILVEQALAMGYKAEGVEPSRYLCNKAKELGLSVHLGKLPHPDVKPPYDVVTMVDVLEHVSNPMKMLEDVKEVLSDDGVGLLVTPDVGSVMAILMRSKWWHYRIAHIGYFQRSSLIGALDKVGFEPVLFARPGWYFSGDYLVERLNSYMPGTFHLPVFPILKKITIPLNLFDSLLVIFKKKTK